MLSLEPLSCSANVPAADVLKLRNKLVTLSSRGSKCHRARKVARLQALQGAERVATAGERWQQEAGKHWQDEQGQGAVSCRRGRALGGSQRQTRQQRTPIWSLPLRGTAHPAHA